MKVVFDFVELREALAKVFDRGLDCRDCPYSQKCDGCDNAKECAEMFISQLAKERIFKMKRY